MSGNNSSNAGSNLVCFLLGAAVGAAVALLYAPQEGQATRQMIGEKAQEARGKATELSHTAREKWGVVTDKAHEFLQRGETFVEELEDMAADNAHAPANSPSEA